MWGKILRALIQAELWEAKRGEILPYSPLTRCNPFLLSEQGGNCALCGTPASALTSSSSSLPSSSSFSSSSSYFSSSSISCSSPPCSPRCHARGSRMGKEEAAVTGEHWGEVEVSLRDKGWGGVHGDGEKAESWVFADFICFMGM